MRLARCATLVALCVACVAQTSDRQYSVDGSMRIERLSADEPAPFDLQVTEEVVPVVTGIEPAVAPISGGKIVATIMGSDFGQSAAGQKAFIGGNECLKTTFVSATEIDCVVPPGIGNNQSVIVDVLGLSSDGNFTGFSYEDPVILAISPSVGGLAGSTMMEVTGRHFGDKNTAIDVEIGGVPCLETTWVNETTLKCLTPPGAGSDLCVTVKVGEHVSCPAGGPKFTYVGTSITKIDPSCGPAYGGTELTIRGTNLGTEHMKASVVVGGVPCENIEYRSDNVLTCTTGANTPGSAKVVVSVMQKCAEGTFFYKAPEIHSMQPDHGPLYGGAKVEVMGDFLGTTDRPANITIGGIPCREQIFHNEQHVTCITPTHKPGASKVVANVNGIASLKCAMFNFETPRVFSIDPASGPTYGRSIITLHGANFGTSRAQKPSVRVGGMPCLKTAWQSESIVQCLVPPAIAGPAAVTVHEEHEHDEVAVLFMYESPTVVAIHPDHGSTMGDYRISISGKHLGRDHGIMFPNVTVGGASCTDVEIKGGDIRCTVPPGRPGAFDVKVTVLGKSSESVARSLFTYQGPVVRAVTPSRGPTYGGIRVSVVGANLGSEKTLPEIFFGKQPCEDVEFRGDGEVACTLPHAAAGTVEVTATLLGQSIELHRAQFTFEAPVIRHVDPASGPSYGGNRVKVSGANFGSSAAMKTRLFVGGHPCDETKWISETEAECVMPAAEAVGPAALSVQVLNQRSPSCDVSSPECVTYGYSGPEVMHIEPTTGPSYGGTRITITGSNLGRKDDERATPIVTIGKQLCESVRIEASNKISCNAPPSGPGPAEVTVNVRDMTTESHGVFLYEGPSVRSVEPASGPTYGGGVVTITGDYFGRSGMQATAFVGGRACDQTTRVSETEIRCTVPDGAEGMATVVVEVNEVTSNLKTKLYEFKPPLVASVTPAHAATYGATWVTIHGKRFGTSGKMGQYASVGGAACSKVEWRSESELRCLLPAGRPGVEGVIVGVADAESAPMSVFSYDPPVVTSVSPPRGPAYGENVIEVHGRNFGTKGLEPQVFIGELPCTETEYVDSKHLKCTVPAAQVGKLGLADVTVVVTAESRSASSVHYEYVGPSVSHVTPAKGPAYGGTEVTLYGTGFGRSEDGVEAFVGKRSCQTTTWVSETEVKCVVPTGPPNAHEMKGPARLSVRVGPHRSATRGAETSFVYEAPVVSHVSPAFGPSYGGTKVDIFGRNFGSGEQHVAVHIGGRLCLELEQVSETHLTCIVPPGAGEHNEVVVEADNFKSSDKALFFSYRAPEVTRVVPAAVPVYGHVWVSVHGSGFGSPRQRAVVFVGGVECIESKYVSSKQVNCLVPASTRDAESEENVVVHVRDRAGAGARPTVSFSSGDHRLLTYKPIRVSQVHPATGPAYGGATLKLSGINLGVPGEADLEPTVTVGGVPCKVTEFKSNRTLECETGPNTPGDKAVVVAVLDKKSHKLDAGYGCEAPEVASVTPAEGPVYGGERIRVHGRYLGRPGMKIQVLVGGIACESSRYISASEVECVTPADTGSDKSAGGAGGERSVSVVIGAVASAENDAFYTYTGPEVHGVKPDHGASYGGTEVEIRGANLGNGEVDVEAYVGGVKCTKTKFVSPSAVKCVVPSMRKSSSVLGSAVTVRVGSHNTAKNPGVSFRYDGPSIRAIVPSSGPTYGTTTVVVRGDNLGTSKHPPTVSFNGVPCLKVHVVSERDVQCTLPPGRAGPAEVVVAVADESSDVVKSFTYAAPAVEQVMPAYGEAYGNQIITLVGSNLGTKELPPKVWIGGVPCRETQFVSSGVVKCRTPPGEGSDQDVVVTVSGHTSEGGRAAFSFSNDKEATFSYQAPHVDGIEPATGPDYGHNVITIIGRGFGTSETKAVAAVGGVPCMKTEYVSETRLKCTVPSLPPSPCPRCGKHDAKDPARVFKVSVLVLGHESTHAKGGHVDYTYAPIVVSEIKPNHGPTYGNTTIRVTGQHFGDAEGPLSPVAFVGGIPCLRTTRVAEGVVECIAPPNTQGNGSVTVQVMDQTSNKDDASYQYVSPEVHRVVPNRGPTYGGQHVRIFGVHFGTPELPPVAYIGGQPCLSTKRVSAFEIDCVAPPGRQTKQNQCVTVTVAGEASTTNELFAYVAPFVRSISTTTGYESGHSKMTIEGEWFGGKDQHTVASIGGVPCARTTVVDEETIECITPAGCGDDNTVAVTVDGVTSNQTHLFAYEPLKVDRVSPFTGPSAGGFTVRVYGTGFGTASDGAVVYIGGRKCTATKWISPHRLECTAPPGVGTCQSVVVTVHHLSSQDNNMFEYAAPSVEQVLPRTVSTKGGDVITVHGQSFGGKDDLAVAFVGGVPCGHTEWVSHGQLKCTVPPGVGTDRCVQVAVLDRISDEVEDSAKVSYIAPVVSTVDAGATIGHVPIVLHGTNLGPDPELKADLLKSGEEEIEASAREGIVRYNATMRAHKLKKAKEIAARKAMRSRNTAAERLMEATSRRIRIAQELHARGVGEAARQENRKEMEVLRYETLAAKAEARAKMAVSRANAEEMADAAFKQAKDASDYADMTRKEMLAARKEAAKAAYAEFKEAQTQSKKAAAQARAAIEAARLNADHVRIEGQRERQAAAEAAVEQARVEADVRMETVAKEHEGEVLNAHRERRASATEAATKITAAKRRVGSERNRAREHWQALGAEAKRNMLPGGSGMDVDETQDPEAKRWNTVGPDGVIPAKRHAHQQEHFEDVHAEANKHYSSGIATADEVKSEATRFVVDDPAAVEEETEEQRRDRLPEIAVLPGENVDDVEKEMAKEAAERASADPNVAAAAADESAVKNKLLLAEKRAAKAAQEVPLMDESGTSAAEIKRAGALEASDERKASEGEEARKALAGLDALAMSALLEEEGQAVRRGMMAAQSGAAAKSAARRLRRGAGAQEGAFRIATTLGAAHEGAAAGDAAGNAPQVVSAESLAGEILEQEIAAKRDMEREYHHVKVEIDGEECVEAEIIDSTSIRCLVAPGVGGGKTVKVIVGGQEVVAEGAYTYAAPVVRRVSERPPTAGDKVVRLEGVNFGPWESEIKVHVGAATCGKVKWISDSELECVAPAGIGANRPVQVTVAGVKGKEHKVWHYATPRVDSVTPSHGVSDGDYLMTILGEHFGPSDNALSISVGGRMCLESVWLSDTEVKCRVPAGVGADQAVVVTVGGQKSTGEESGKFSYHVPEVTSYAPENPGTNGGASVTVHGNNFGTNVDTHVVRFGKHASKSVTIVSPHQLVATVPEGAGSDLNLEVEVGGQRNEPWEHFAYAAPVVKAVEPATAPAAGGARVTVVGANFGAEADAAVVFLGEFKCTETRWVSHEKLECVVPAGAGASLDAHVVVGDQRSEKGVTFSYVAPVVRQISPRPTAAKGGDVVTFIGLHFGPDGKHVEAFIGGSKCSHTKWVSDSELRCTVPAGVGKEVGAHVASRGQHGPVAMVFAYEAPEVLKVDPAHAPAKGGKRITFHGRNFGPRASVKPVAFVGEKRCDLTVWVSDEKVECVVPEGVGNELSVRVEVGGQGSRGAVHFAYDLPDVHHVDQGAPTTGGKMLNVYGKNFGARDYSARVTIGGRACTSVVWVDDSTLECAAPEGTGKDRSVVVEVGGQQSELDKEALFSYDAPMLESVSPQAGDPLSGIVLTIVGRNFGTKPGAVALVGGKKCTRTIWKSDNVLQCVLPEGYAKYARVDVHLHGLEAYNKAVFSYGAPAVSSITPRSTGTEGGKRVVVRGRNLPMKGADAKVEVEIGGRACADPKVVADGAVECTVPAGSGANRVVDIWVNDRQGNGAPLFSYTAPAVLSVSPVSAEPEGGAELVLHGTDFGRPGTPVEVMVGGEYPCVEAKVHKDGTVRCKVTPGAGKCLSVKAIVSGQLQTLENRLFTYAADGQEAAVVEVNEKTFPSLTASSSLVVFVADKTTESYHILKRTIDAVAKATQCGSIAVGVLDTSKDAALAAKLGISSEVTVMFPAGEGTETHESFSGKQKLADILDWVHTVEKRAA